MQTETGVKEILGSILAGFAASLLIACGIIAHSLFESNQRARENLETSYSVRSAVAAVQNLSVAPPPTQASIDEAIAMFKIQLPKDIVGPSFDPMLSDRGLTMRRGALSQIQVFIGPDAFSSWSLLGSTLAHEVEVHCRQNFLAIHLMDLAGLDGTGTAEREAYTYELRNADRFGLAPYDRDLIRSTSSYYYPRRNFSFTQLQPLEYLMSKISRIDTRSQPKPTTSQSL